MFSEVDKDVGQLTSTVVKPRGADSCLLLGEPYDCITPPSSEVPVDIDSLWREAEQSVKWGL